MAVGDIRTFVTQAKLTDYAARKDNITDDLETDDPTKRASAKAVKILNEKIENLAASSTGDSNEVDADGKLLSDNITENPDALIIKDNQIINQTSAAAADAMAEGGTIVNSLHNKAVVNLVAESGAGQGIVNIKGDVINIDGVRETAPGSANQLWNNGGLLQLSGEDNPVTPLNGQVLMFNETSGRFQAADVDVNAPAAEVFIAKRYIEIIAVHKSMNVLNVDSLINAVYNNYKGKIVNIGAYTTSGNCKIEMFVDGVSVSAPMSVSNSNNMFAQDIDVDRDTLFTFKATDATVNTKGLVIFIDMNEIVPEKQSKIKRFIQCPAVHQNESLLNTDSAINKIFCPYKGLLLKINAFTTTGTCNLITQLNGVDIMTQTISEQRTGVEMATEIFKLDEFNFRIENANGTGLVIVLEIEET
jgi:hypothetical protein